MFLVGILLQRNHPGTGQTVPPPGRTPNPWPSLAAVSRNGPTRGMSPFFQRRDPATQQFQFFRLGLDRLPQLPVLLFQHRRPILPVLTHAVPADNAGPSIAGFLRASELLRNVAAAYSNYDNLAGTSFKATRVKPILPATEPWPPSRGMLQAHNVLGSRDVAALVGASLLNLMDAVIREQGSLPPEQRRGALVVVDEMQTMPGVDYESMLSELGKFGASFILATQSLAKLDDLSPIMSDTILANVGQAAL